MTTTTPRLLLTAAEAAEALSLSRSTVYIELSSGRLESISVGRARRIPVDAVERWLEARRAESAHPTAA